LKVPPSRFQFTIKGLLWATFWVAVAGAAWVADGLSQSLSRGESLAVLITVAQVACPIIAVGVLAERTLWGFVFGLPLGAVWLLIVVLAS
jgi:hypothetical protein